ncbi:MAG: hypothetical protein ACREEK_17310 [Bradyrhizobium sp.]
MFQLLSRARAQKGDRDFRVRSVGRDTDTDRSRVSSVLDALDVAIREAELEQSGLGRRVEDVLARAAVTFGNGTDEYLERDPLDSHHQTLFSNEIANGQRRLNELATTIAHFRFLKAALLSRFPDFRPAA